jgi:hypothetical protein
MERPGPPVAAVASGHERGVDVVPSTDQSDGIVTANARGMPECDGASSGVGAPDLPIRQKSHVTGINFTGDPGTHIRWLEGDPD